MNNSFIEAVVALLKKIDKEENTNIVTAGKQAAEKIAGGGLIYLFGCGHSHILAEEGFYRAGGLAAVQPLFHEPLMLHEGAVRSSVLEKENGYAETFINDCAISEKDLLIVASTAGINPVSIDVALFAKEKGAEVVVITSKTYSMSQKSRHIRQYRLLDVGDVVVDNHAPIGDAIMTNEKLATPYGPSSTVTGAAILQSIFSVAIEELLASGITPPVFLSGNVENAAGHNEKLVNEYKKRISLLR